MKMAITFKREPKLKKEPQIKKDEDEESFEEGIKTRPKSTPLDRSEEQDHNYSLKEKLCSAQCSINAVRIEPQQMGETTTPNTTMNKEANQQKTNKEANQQKTNKEANQQKTNKEANQQKTNKEANQQKTNKEANQQKTNKEANQQKTNKEANQQKTTKGVQQLRLIKVRTTTGKLIWKSVPRPPDAERRIPPAYPVGRRQTPQLKAVSGTPIRGGISGQQQDGNPSGEPECCEGSSPSKHWKKVALEKAFGEVSSAAFASQPPLAEAEVPEREQPMEVTQASFYKEREEEPSGDQPPLKRPRDATINSIADETELHEAILRNQLSLGDPEFEEARRRIKSAQGDATPMERTQDLTTPVNLASSGNPQGIPHPEVNNLGSGQPYPGDFVPSLRLKMPLSPATLSLPQPVPTLNRDSQDDAERRLLEALVRAERDAPFLLHLGVGTSRPETFHTDAHLFDAYKRHLEDKVRQPNSVLTGEFPSSFEARTRDNHLSHHQRKLAFKAMKRLAQSKADEEELIMSLARSPSRIPRDCVVQTHGDTYDYTYAVHCKRLGLMAQFAARYPGDLVRLFKAGRLRGDQTCAIIHGRDED
jgi:hypothetical protein